MHRRDLLRAGVACALSAGTVGARAQAATPAFPRLRMLIPANAGGGWDQTGRALGQALVSAGAVGDLEYENKGGKGGVLGLAHFAEHYGNDPAALLVGGFVMVGSVALHRPAVDFSRVTPIARLTTELPVLVVPASSRYRSLAAFAADLKAKPAAVPIAGGGAGGVDHVCAAMIARAVGLDPSVLLYQPMASGADVLAAVAGGQVAAAVSGYGEMKDGLASGRLRALGITSKRSTYGLPSMVEQGVPVELGNWRGVFGAAGLSTGQAAALRDAVQRATAQPSWKEALQRNSWQSAWQVGAEFQQSLDLDLAMSRVLVQLLRLKAS